MKKKNEKVENELNLRRQNYRYKREVRIYEKLYKSTNTLHMQATWEA